MSKVSPIDDNPFSPSRTALWLLLALFVVSADQLTKVVATSLLDYAQPVAATPFLNWTLLYNPGAAFSFLSDAGGWQRWLFSFFAFVMSVVLIFWIKHLQGKFYLQKMALAFILGGALGNLFDRVLMGYVIDFIQVHYQNRHYFPAFNVADSAITLGAIMMIIDSFLNKSSPSPSTDSEGS